VTARRLSLGLSLVACGLLASHAAPRARAETPDARLARAATRCTKFAELIACDEALSIKPDDPDLLIAEADTLVKRDRPGEAIGVYRNAARHGARASVINPRVVAAAAQRRTLLGICMSADAIEAEPACEAAWLPGAPDEVGVFKRRGQILEERGQSTAALDAYLTAARLRPRDRGVAQAVVALTKSTGRKDAATLTAMGTASMTLGHRAAAVGAYREALRLTPEFAAAKEGLRLAEHPAPHPADVASSPEAFTEPTAAPQAGDLGPFSNAADVTHSN
jgi:tetratricopeptide (TPR) repeat protein